MIGRKNYCYFFLLKRNLKEMNLFYSHKVTRMWIIILSIIALVVYCKFFSNKGLTEHFGGQIKSMKRVPKTTCYNICGQYYSDCMSRYAGVDAGFCHNRLNSCKRVCDYSDFMVV